ncbi:MAG TPA: M14 metallopeptidase family protein [Bryobacteraceae bacterium]|nr:M14 metallopeptidase family protein [Bryobacteraceae bacterium]
MTPSRITRVAAFLLLGCVALPAQPKSPEQTFGFKMGADHKLVKWPQIVEYFHALAASSNKVKIIDAGKSSEGNPMIVAVISSPENLARLDHYKQVSQHLAHPGDLSPEDAEKLIADEKVLVAISCSIHASEIAATQLSMELAYDLATKDTPEVRRILDQDIVLLWPSHNPDGNIIVADWYNRNVGTKYENAPLPWLYHKYVGHDNNRDWFMLNLDETKVVTKFYFKEWFPPVLYDIHQMGRTGARLFVPPFMDPLNPNIHPLIWRGINLLGTHMAEAEEEAGHTGVAQNILYTSWWEGNSLQQPWFHNMVSVLTEAASPNVASPVTQTAKELTGNTPGLPEYALRENFSNPWPGGVWRLRDVVEYEYTAAMAVLDTAARYREDFLRDFYKMGREEIRKGETEPPYAYIVPAAQRDENTAVKMVNLLIDQGAEVERATADFTAGGVSYGKGSYVLLMAQPFRPFVKDIMEPQHYPDVRAFPGGPPVPPYDVAGWTLPLQMGVASVMVKSKFNATLTPVTRAEPPPPEIAAGGGKTSAFVLGHEENDSLIAVNRLLKAGYDVYWSQTGFANHAPGTMIIPAQGAKQAQVKSIAQSLSLPLGEINGAVDVAAYKLKPLRLALFNPWGGNMDEGWTRLMLERFEFPYEEIRPADVRSGDFAKRFDVVVFADQPPRAILDGISADRIQPEYAGGIGPAGLGHLREFVRNGGTIIALGNASEMFIEGWQLPVVDVVAGLKTTEFFCPGSILDMRVDPTHPAGFGMPEETSGFFARSSAFEIKPSNFAPAGQVRTIVKYAGGHVLQSGWILGESHLYDRAAAVDISMEKGHVILFGFRVQNRAQPHATFKLFFNSLYYGPAESTLFRSN